MDALTAILAVFTAIGNWFVQTITSLTPIFYVASGDDAGLTVIGALSVSALGVGLIMLIVNKISDFLKFR